MSIQIFAADISPRLRYAAKIMFEILLGVEYSLSSDLKCKQAGDFLISPSYSTIFQAGFPLQPGELKTLQKQITSLDKEKDPNTFLSILLSAIFYFGSLFEEHLDLPRDKHGRLKESETFSVKSGLNSRPFLHEWAEKFWEMFKIKSVEEGKELPHREKKTFSWEITIDIDNPWKYRHKGAIINSGGMLRGFAEGKFRQELERIQSILSGEDPFDCYEQIFKLCPPENTRFFFLTARNSFYDSRFTLANPAYRQLINRLTVEKGYPGGLHPSYDTSVTPGMLTAEKNRLEKLIPNLNSSRQHYLRFKVPQTFQELESAGIRDEYSLAPHSYVGFSIGLAVPYPWYDLEKERETNLVLHPCMAMDRGLQKYMKLKPAAAAKAVKVIIDQTRKANGKFVLILHNETFSESGEWRGWMPFIREITEYLNHAGPTQKK